MPVAPGRRLPYVAEVPEKRVERAPGRACENVGLIGSHNDIACTPPEQREAEERRRRSSRTPPSRHCEPLSGQAVGMCGVGGV